MMGRCDTDLKAFVLLSDYRQVAPPESAAGKVLRDASAVQPEVEVAAEPVTNAEQESSILP